MPKNGPKHSIFRFADDTLFLGEWSTVNAKNLMRLLRCFHISSGLSINFSKRRVIGVGVSSQEVGGFARVLSCIDENLPFNYLGLSVGGSMTRKNNWQCLVDKFKNKLSYSIARCLSFGGKLVICKSVHGHLGSYMFSLYKAPNQIIKNLVCIRRNFFWGGNSDKRKVEWVAWNKVLNLKALGVLEFGSLQALNC